MFGIDARMAKLVDARDLKSLGGNTVPVQVRFRAPPKWCHRQVVRPQPAKLLSPVQIRVAPPLFYVTLIHGDLAELVDSTGLENRRG